MTRTLRRFKQKAPGRDTIQLTTLPPSITKHLLYIFDNALSAGYFPDTLKHEHIFFISKSNTSQSNIKKYRPISLQDIQGKLFDRILNTRLTHHLDIRNIHNDWEHRFRKHRGTHTALATFYEILVSGQPSLPLRIFRHRLRSRLLPALSIHCNHNVFSPCQRW